MVKKSSHTICFFGAAAGFLILAIGVFLFHPASYLILNKGVVALRTVASLMFWIGLLAGIGLLIAASLILKKKAPDFLRDYKEKASENGKAAWLRRSLLKTKLSILMLVFFVVGVVGSAICIANNPLSTYHTFFFIALAVLGIFEYIVFNSKNFMYIVRRSEKNEE